LHFAPSLVRAIHACPLQEIATHTFSHYYCLEDGQTAAEFAADLQSARAIAAARGIELQSIVFPRNQVNTQHLTSLMEAGIQCFRGTAPCALHDAADFATQRRPYKRALRLADAYLPIFGNDVVDWPVPVFGELYELKASRYFRPYTPSLSYLAGRAIHRIKSGMDLAAREGRIYHLWFHPEDFGLYPEENLALLSQVVDFYLHLRAIYGMQSLSMIDAVAAVSSQSPFRCIPDSAAHVAV
jgi:peptidoglycan/xylan/chitin deacetylase (PgdA/CDA1 family)